MGAHVRTHTHGSGCIAEVGMEGGGEVSPLVTGPGSVWFGSSEKTKFHGTKAGRCVLGREVVFFLR